MSKFKMPERAAQRVEDWVSGEGVSTQPEKAEKAPGQPPGGKQARLTIDLPPELHARFKATCALQGTRMIDQVRSFIEEWTQKHR